MLLVDLERTTEAFPVDGTDKIEKLVDTAEQGEDVAAKGRRRSMLIDETTGSQHPERNGQAMGHAKRRAGLEGVTERMAEVQ